MIILLRQHNRINRQVSSEINHIFLIFAQVNIRINILCNNGIEEGEGGLIGINFHWLS